MDDQDIVTTLQDSLYDLVDGAVAFLPKLLVALILLIVGIVVARFVARIVQYALGFVENNKWTKKFFSSVEVNMLNISEVTAIFVKWAVFIIFINAAIDVLGLSLLSETFDTILAFVPKIFAAVVVAGLSLIAAKVMHDLVLKSATEAKITAAKTLATATQVVVLVFGLPLAAAQLGLDLTIINNNITVVVAGFMLAFAIAFGMGGRETAGKIVNDIYKSFKK